MTRELSQPPASPFHPANIPGSPFHPAPGSPFVVPAAAASPFHAPNPAGAASPLPYHNLLADNPSLAATTKSTNIVWHEGDVSREERQKYVGQKV